MLRIAILEKEDVTKDILFEFGRVLSGREWTFQYFSKITELVKTDVRVNFDIIVLHEHFMTPRIMSFLDENKPYRLLIICGKKKEHLERMGQHQRIIYLDRSDMKSSIKDMEDILLQAVNLKNGYTFSYNGVHVNLKIEDIYYLEKDKKTIIFHTKRGDFNERGSLIKKENEFKDYEFIRIHTSFLVNFQYIWKVEENSVELINHTKLPISRVNRAKVSAYFRDKIE